MLTKEYSQAAGLFSHTHTMTPAVQLIDSLQQAARQDVVVAGVLTSQKCPWCVALEKEQLIPRMRARGAPKLIVLAFDVDDRQMISFPDGSKRNARQWGALYSMKLTPTLAMLDAQAKPLAAPLVGYGSRDFYGAYLEEQIQNARIYWQNRRS